MEVLQGHSDSPPEVMIERVQDILTSAATSSCPPRKTCPVNRNRLWNAEIERTAKISKSKFYEWKQAGRPPEKTHPQRIELLEAKRDLRRAQRQTEADGRNRNHVILMEASEHDHGLFYKLVRKQRSDNSRVPEEILFGNTKVREPKLADAWAEYFCKLATPADDPAFDNEFLNSCELQCALLDQLMEANTDTSQIPRVTADEVRKIVMSLKNNKAPDVSGLSAEHLKKSPAQLFDVLAVIFNQILSNTAAPASFTTGIITPVHKKGKPVKNADSYRRITVTPILSKLLDKLLLPEQDSCLDECQNKLQRGFTTCSSSANTALLITEACAEAKDKKEPIYVAYLDASKAFDVVCHPSLLKCLYDQGLRGDLWRVVASYYASMSSRVKWNGTISNWFMEGQGIRQGGIQSTRHFKARGNALLNTYTEHDMGAKIGTVTVSAPTCADDVTLLANTPPELQVMLNAAAQDSHRERYQFSKSKTKVMTVNIKAPSGPLISTGRWELESAPLEVVCKQDHLGLVRESDPARVESLMAERVQLGRRSTYAFMGAGFHGLNGLHPLASNRIWDTYVLPRLIHSLEALVLPEKEISKLEIYQRSTLRRIQHLPQSTSNNAVYLLLGVCPITGTIHRNTLVFFVSLLLQHDSLERAIIGRQLAMKDLASSSWVVYVRKLLHEYNLPSAYTLFNDPPTKSMWKATVKKGIRTYYNRKLKDGAFIQSSLKYLNTAVCQVGKPHPLWSSVHTNKLDILRGAVKAKLLTGSYMLQARISKHSGGTLPSLCLLCRQAREDTVHFILTCSALKNTRDPYLQQIRTLIPGDHSLGTDWSWNNPTTMTQVILDCSHPCLVLPPGIWPAVEVVSRRLCYALHAERAVQMVHLQPGGDTRAVAPIVGAP
jgi:hypothetical protein